MTFSVTQYGKPLDPSKYFWDEDKKIFSTKENDLVLDFSDYYFITFNTGYSCYFHTGSDCILISPSAIAFDREPEK